MPTNQPFRSVLAVVLSVGIAWQVYVITVAWRYGPPLHTLLIGLGADLPPITRWLIDSYQWWFAAPLICTALAADVLRRRQPPAAYVLVVVFLTVATGFVLQAWTNEAWFAPVLHIIRSIR